MNDAEIIKGLECCRHSFCCDCPYEKYSENCTDKLLAEAHRFVKHQQAEIEKSKKIQQRQANLIIEERGRRYELASDFTVLKSEAIKDFAEKLKNLIYPQLGMSTYEKGEAFHFCLDEIDNLIKIIAGGEK